MKLTKRKGEILKIIKSFNDYFSLTDIKDIIKKKRLNISRVTIYRNLKSLLKKGKIKEVVVGKNKSYYEYIDKKSRVKHHHHIICLSCNDIVDFRIKIFEFILSLIEFLFYKVFKFKTKFHNLDFYGYCKKCYNKIT
ncbi:MAG: Fur family transcriptional regulator [Microgenomates group bacterium]